jgi:hypothetical protein
MSSSTPPASDPPLGHAHAIHGADRRVNAIAAVASVVVHLVLVVLYASSGSAWGPLAATVSLQSSDAAAEGMQVVQIVEIDADEPSAEAPIEEVELEIEVPVEQPTIEAARPSGEILDEAGEGLDPVHAAEVLRVRVTDARLWTVTRPDLLELTETERMRLRLAGRLEAWNDSVAAVREAEAAMLDWTTTDSEGNKWGVSPGKLHLGKMTLPLPFGFGPNPWQAEQYAKRQARDQDIQTHSTDVGVRESWRERAEAIRRRRDRERREEEEARTEVEPDTSSARRRGGVPPHLR